ncbi:MAG: Pseudouridine-5'-phosphate glycosidase [Chloroflexi bacterium ADurb.Bin325]|nr:MAG: Pseudouridine-5'-phosphate glycosidase [Chloroflexi bacterium ADurb.Bin325]
MATMSTEQPPFLVRVQGGPDAPALALESTVISHGLPYPQNLETALRLERLAREAGAQPATIGILRGQVVVGLNRGEIEHLATAPDVRKVSRRDLPVVRARGLDGATTVATTAWAAQRAGIRVFATGGIGGVHRAGGWKPETGSWKLEVGGWLSADISADLPELAQTPIIVVCAGAKAILDLPATLEWLETYGVTVVGYGTERFPAFYNRDSGLPVDVRADTPAEVAALYRSQRELGLAAGLLVTVPVPAEAELPADEMEAAIGQALHEAQRADVRGRALTPFLLARVSELTGAASLAANLALLENNVRVGAQIAAALANKK